MHLGHITIRMFVCFLYWIYVLIVRINMIMIIIGTILLALKVVSKTSPKFTFSTYPSLPLSVRGDPRYDISTSGEI